MFSYSEPNNLLINLEALERMVKISKDLPALSTKERIINNLLHAIEVEVYMKAREISEEVADTLNEKENK